jgi:four helix bundle protein
MKYQRFEELPVWNAAADLAVKVFDWTAQRSLRGKGDLANQLQRATLSISNNIAEGFERGTTSELLQFLYFARGSAGETRSMLCVLQRMAEFQEFESEILGLQSDCERISRQLHGWAQSLQNSDIRGPRHLSDQSRNEYQMQKEREASQRQRQEFHRQLEARLKEEARRRAERGAGDTQGEEVGEGD